MQTLTAKPCVTDRARPATLADVAREAGVSIATVSRVLNSKLAVPITPETERRIREASDRLGYRPNAIARALATQRTHTLALFTDEMTDPHFAQMLGPVEQSLRERGYRLAVCSDIEGMLAEGRVDGAILLADPVTGPARFGAIGIPVAYVWSASSACRHCVSWNDTDGAALAVRHLSSLGHARIAGLFGDYPLDGAPPDKVVGFRAAAAAPGATSREWLGSLAPHQFENGYMLVRQALAEKRDWTAIFARNDYLALGALRALREAGVAVPEQVAVVGYNDTELARFADPPLTSVRTPIAECGALAAVRLVEAIESGSSQIVGEELSMRLTIRGSCGAGRTAAE